MSHSVRQKDAQRAIAASKPRIFIVEDEIVIVMGLEEALTTLGYEVCGFAFSGEEAIGLIEKRKPDIALVDIHLRGDMDGIELAGRITTHWKTPVIYITAFSDREVLDRAKITDPSGYIVKPVRFSQLQVNIELAMERCRREKEKNAVLEAYRKTIEELQRDLYSQDERFREFCNDLNLVTEERDRQKVKLNELRLELQEVNKSLLSLTTHMARIREELEMEVAAAVHKKIMPILKQLRSDPSFQHYRIELEMLGMHMDHLASTLRKHIGGVATLSAVELRIAAMIKNEFTSKQIAGLLCISLETVKTHRRNIRKKLGLQNSSTNLTTYLRDRWGEGNTKID